MLPLLLVPVLALGALPVRDAQLAWDGGRLSLSVHVEGALSLEKVNYGVNSHDQLWVAVPGGMLNPGTPAFGEAGNEIRTRHQREGLLLTLGLEDGWDCHRPVTLEALPDGVRASLVCANPPARAAAAAPRPSLETKPAAEAAAAAAAPVAAAATPAAATPAAAEPAAAAEPPPDAPATAPKPADSPLFAAVSRPEASSGPGWGGLAAVVLLLGLAGGAWFLARRRPRAARGIEVLESTSLGPRRSLVLARVGSEVLLLGSSEGGLTLLKILTASEAAAMGSEPSPARSTALARGAAPAAGFQSLLEESVEDQELRRKLEMGLGGRVP